MNRYRVTVELDNRRRVEEVHFLDETHDEFFTIVALTDDVVVVVVDFVDFVARETGFHVSFVVGLDQEQNENWTDEAEQYLTIHHRQHCVVVQGKFPGRPSVRPLYKIC